jgi:hypothetical protein
LLLLMKVQSMYRQQWFSWTACSCSVNQHLALWYLCSRMNTLWSGQWLLTFSRAYSLHLQGILCGIICLDNGGSVFLCMLVPTCRPPRIIISHLLIAVDPFSGHGLTLFSFLNHFKIFLHCATFWYCTIWRPHSELSLLIYLSAFQWAFFL